MTQAEELLNLYGIYREIPDDDPKKIEGLRSFNTACENAANDQSFDGHWNALAIQQMIANRWLQSRRKRAI